MHTFCKHQTIDFYANEVLSLFTDFPDSVIYALNLSANATFQEVEEAADKDYFSGSPVYADLFDSDCEC